MFHLAWNAPETDRRGRSPLAAVYSDRLEDRRGGGLATVRPWDPIPTVPFRLDIGTALPPATSESRRKEVASLHLASLPQRGTWVWTDGSAADGVANGGAGALNVWPDGDEDEIRIPAGRLCSSYRADMVDLQATLTPY